MACITANNSRGRRRTFGERDRNGDKRGRVEETRYTEHERLEKFARNYDRTRGREKKSTSACKSRASCSLHALPFLALFCSSCSRDAEADALAPIARWFLRDRLVFRFLFPRKRSSASETTRVVRAIALASASRLKTRLKTTVDTVTARR